MARESEQLALRPPAGTKDRLRALQQDGETLLAVVLRAIEALEQEQAQDALQAPQEVPTAEGRGIGLDGLERRLESLEGRMVDVLRWVEVLESQPQGEQAHPEPIEDATTKSPTAPLLERIPDTARCECRTARGERCKGKVVSIIRAYVGEQVAEFGSCRRHVRRFEPHPDVL